MDLNIKYSNSSEQIDWVKNKIVSLENLSGSKHTGFILTKGAFDLLHYGHLSLFSYLHELKEASGNKIVVAIASDRIVKLKKGDTRPINPENERLLQISMLPQVDYVILHDEADYTNLIKTLQPKVYVKGMDTAGTDLNDIALRNPEFDLLPKDSEIIIFQDDSSISTSEIIKRIKRV